MTLAKNDIYFITPKEATNFITNPSFELNATTGYTGAGTGTTIAASTTYSRRGLYSCAVTPGNNQASFIYYAIALTSGVQYSFSADILDIAGQTYNLYIGDASSVRQSDNVTWTGTGYWKRRSVTWTANASATFRLIISRNAIASTAPWYTDGWQFEVGAVSTYLDGDMRGFVNGDTSYRWNGTPHASTSWRSGQTRSGGTFVKLSTYGRVLATPGLGMSPVSNIAIPSTLGGSYYQNTIAPDRAFSIIEYIYGSTADYSVIEKNKAALEDAIKPDPVTNKQPMLIQIDQLDATGLELAETLFVKAVYEGGLENMGNGTPQGEMVTMNFRTYVPYLLQQGEKGVSLGYQSSVANANYILQRSTAGVWAAMATGANSTAHCFQSSLDGSIYIGGQFTNLGDANGDGISKWNGTAFSSLSTGLGSSSGFCDALAMAADGSLYIGGLFINIGGANGDYIVKWDGNAFSSLGTGTNGEVLALAIGQDGSLYAGGEFTLAGGVANTVYIAKWDGANWTPLSTGADGYVFSLAIGVDGCLYAGGLFHNIGGVAALHVAKWNGTTWSALGTGAADYVYALAVGWDGCLYMGGNFATAGGVANTSRIAKWNGTTWSALGTGLDNTVRDIAIDPNTGFIYACGDFLTAGGLTLPERMAMWTGTCFIPLDVNLPGTPSVYALDFDRLGNLYIGFNQSGTATSATVTVSNVGSGSTYPTVIFTGPGSFYQLKNYTTGKAIYFNLSLFAGEQATLVLDPQRVSFTSTFRGNLMSYIWVGSNLNFELLPGANNISTYMFGGTSAATAVQMLWRDQYWSIDGAVR
jgi:hypothetical protein